MGYLVALQLKLCQTGDLRQKSRHSACQLHHNGLVSEKRNVLIIMLIHVQDAYNACMHVGFTHTLVCCAPRTHMAHHASTYRSRLGRT